MKILFLLNNDTYATSAFEIVLSKLYKHKIKIILSRKVGKKISHKREILELKKHENAKPNWSEEFGFKTTFCEDINSEETVKEVRKFAPDLIISIRFGQILQQEIIDIPRHGVLNLHSGILPDYRGIMPSFWVILNGEKKIGTTLHYIQDKRIDAGDIISFSEEKIDYDSTLFLNVRKLYDKGCKLVIGAIEKISRGEKIKTVKQSELGASNYFSYPNSEDVERFLRLMRLF